jgi:hypothetical protein
VDSRHASRLAGPSGAWRRALSFTLAVACAALLGGCASARPGVAAQVGSSRITLAEVDEASVNLCTAFLPQIETEGGTYPLKVLSGFVVASLTRQAMARQVASDYDLSTPATYDEQVAAAEAAAEQIAEDVRETYLELSVAGPYADAIMQEAGRAALAEDGVTEATPEEQLTRGQQVFADWVEDNEVEIDPRYSLQVVDGSVVAADTSTSVAVSPAALAGQADQMDPAAAAELPSSQRCN